MDGLLGAVGAPKVVGGYADRWSAMQMYVALMEGMVVIGIVEVSALA